MKSFLVFILTVFLVSCSSTEKNYRGIASVLLNEISFSAFLSQNTKKSHYGNVLNVLIESFDGDGSGCYVTKMHNRLNAFVKDHAESQNLYVNLVVVSPDYIQHMDLLKLLYGLSGTVVAGGKDINTQLLLPSNILLSDALNKSDMDVIVAKDKVHVAKLVSSSQANNISLIKLDKQACKN